MFAAESLAQRASSFPISGKYDTASTSAGGQISASRTSDAHVTDPFPSFHKEPEVWMRNPVSMSLPIDMNLHPANNAGVVAPHDPQVSNPQLLNGPLSAPPPEPASQPRLGPRVAILHHNEYLIASPMPSRAPQNQSTSANATGQCKKKNWCSLCDFHFSQPQVLSRHMKDKHEDKGSCSFCSCFKWSRGRPYIYIYHLRMRHPQIPLPEVRQKGPKTLKVNSMPRAWRLVLSIHTTRLSLPSLTIIVR